MTGRLKRQLWHLLIALDQLLNVLLGGCADETLSSRIYRHAVLAVSPRRRWLWAYKAVNTLFFWQADHCAGAWQRERARAHLPEALQ